MLRCKPNGLFTVKYTPTKMCGKKFHVGPAFSVSFFVTRTFCNFYIDLINFKLGNEIINYFCATADETFKVWSPKNVEEK